MLPARADLVVCFAHVAYRLLDRFGLRETGITAFEVRDAETLAARLAEADVLVVSGLWRNTLLERAPRLRLIQSISAGTDQYDRAALVAHGVRLASAQGANARAVAEHAMALILALARRLPEACHNQARGHWRGMIGELSQREDEVGGKTLLIVGLGGIGGRLAELSRAFGMRVLAIRRHPEAGAGAADDVHGMEALPALLPQADVVALTCPLTPETANLIDGAALARMRSGAVLVNVARGGCVNEAALLAALDEGRIAGAALDVAREEPLPPASPLWRAPNLLLTPHTGGETRRYEDRVIDLLLENLDRLWRGGAELRNQIV
jgi:phosphoglycerate dehydrogenase-like enzyme